MGTVSVDERGPPTISSYYAASDASSVIANYRAEPLTTS